MDYMVSSEGFGTSELSKFQHSPSSLYSYDQDLHHNPTSFTPTCASSSTSTELPPQAMSTETECDPLHPQFETSNNLEGYFSGVLGVRISSPFERIKRELTTISQEDFEKLQPELAEAREVNVDPYLFEDTDSRGFRPEGGSSAALPEDMVVVVDEAACPQGQSEGGGKTFASLQTVRTSQSSAAVARMLQQQAHSAHSSSTTLTPLLTRGQPPSYPHHHHHHHAHSPTPPTTTTTLMIPILSPTHTSVKAEPLEMEVGGAAARDSYSSLSPQARSLSTSPASLPGQSRAPSLGRQGKAGSVEEKWKEIEKFIHDPANVDRKRKRHGSGDSAMSDEESSTSQYMGSMSDSDSDDDSDVSDTPFEESLTELAQKSKQYFWQYNIQAKGPKGTRLHLSVTDEDPHHPSRFEDPVFDPSNTYMVGIRHAGKARKGDGNEINPNPRKLYMIGQKLCRLNREINSIQLTGGHSAADRSKARKEKNRLSSQACRLKKKAQHEANKIKLFGLNCEQGELLDVVHVLWPKLKEQAKQQMKENIPFPSSSMAQQFNSLINAKHKTRIAGHTTDYVNEAIARVEEGDMKGGLDIKPKPLKSKAKNT